MKSKLYSRVVRSLGIKELRKTNICSVVAEWCNFSVQTWSRNLIFWSWRVIFLVTMKHHQGHNPSEPVGMELSLEGQCAVGQWATSSSATSQWAPLAISSLASNAHQGWSASLALGKHGQVGCVTKREDDLTHLIPLPEFVHFHELLFSRHKDMRRLCLMCGEKW